MARRRKTGSKKPKTKPKARKTAKKAPRRATKPKAKRRAKQLVKAPRIASKRDKQGKRRMAPGKKTAKTTAKTARQAIGGKHKSRVKFVRRKLDPASEQKVNSLIARVYRIAADEMRQMEESTVTSKIDVMRQAAEEVVRMQELASKYDGSKK